MTSATPRAPRRPHTWQRPGGTVDDPYAWLRDKSDPATLEYLSAENSWADAWFAERDGLVESIFSEIKSRVKEDDSSYPVKHGDWWYVSHTETGKPYAIHTRGATPESASGQLLLDENIEAAGSDYFSLSAFDVSHDGRLLAWSSDTDGSEMYTIRIRNVAGGVDTDDVIPDTTWGGVAWSADNSHLFYVRPDEAMRPFQVWRHTLGTPVGDDVLVLEEPDERFFVGVAASRSGDWIIIESGSKTSSECWVIDALSPEDQPRSLAPRRDEVEYQIDHWGDVFAVITNLDAPDFRVMTVPVEGGDWAELVPHSASQRIVQFECFRDMAVMVRWEHAQQTLSIVTRDGAVSPIHVSDEPHEAELDSNPDYVTDGVRISYQSLTIPATTAWYSVSGSSLATLKQVEVRSCDLSHYVSTRTWATASDGTSVPVDIVRHRDTPLDGSAPALLYGYGAYEISVAPWFSVARLSLLDRGWVWALVHPRGGGEMGRSWYLDGKLLNKRNTFTDTIDAASHLEQARFCDGSRIVVRGGSAGGLLVGACITMAPDRFAGAIAEVPFVDVVTTMSDPTLPLTVTEWEEWGDPRQEPFASYIASYSPYDNTTPRRYPGVYVTAGLNDPRVSFHEPAKWVARLRHESPGTEVVFKCEMGAGHGGPSGRYDQWRDEARALAFALSRAE